MPHVNSPLLLEYPRAWGFGMVASGLATIVPAFTKLSLSPRSAITGAGAYGVIALALLGLRQTKSLSCRNVVLLTAGALCNAAAWYKIYEPFQQNKPVDIEDGSTWECIGAIYGGLAVGFADKSVELVRSCCSNSDREDPQYQLVDSEHELQLDFVEKT